MNSKRNLVLTFLVLLMIFVVGCAAPAADPTFDLPAPDEPSADEAIEESSEDSSPDESEPVEEDEVEDAEEDMPAEVVEGYPVTIIDGFGNEITLEAKPERIISVTLGTDEILLDLVGAERLIGVTYLAADETTSNIANHPHLALVENVVEADPETIIGLEPDLVFVAAFTDQAVIDQLQAAGMTIFVVGSFTSIDAMKQNILDIGALVGEPARAAGVIAEMDALLNGITALVESSGEEAPTVLYLAGSGWVAGSATTTDDIITRAGGINAAADLVDWKQISAEEIITMNPDVVVISPYVTDEEFLGNPAFAGVAAIVNGRVYAITDSHMSAVSQYIVLGVQDLFGLLYPALEPEG